MRVILVRHAQSRSNVPDASNIPFDPRFADREDGDHSLTPMGQKQAFLTGERLKNIHIDWVICSPFHRTMQTCANILSRRKEHLDIEISHDIVESGCYGFDMMSKELYDTIWDRIIVPPRPEQMLRDDTDEKRWERADRFTEMLYGRFPEDSTVLVVTHGYFSCSYLIAALMKLPKDVRNNYKFGAENCGITVIDKNKDGTFFVSAVDDTSHLDDLKSFETYDVGFEGKKQ